MHIISELLKFQSIMKIIVTALILIKCFRVMKTKLSVNNDLNGGSILQISSLALKNVLTDPSPAHGNVGVPMR